MAFVLSSTLDPQGVTQGKLNGSSPRAGAVTFLSGPDVTLSCVPMGTFRNAPSWCGSDTKELVNEENGHLSCSWCWCDLASSAAYAAPLTKGFAMLPNDNIENVRLVCDQYG